MKTWGISSNEAEQFIKNKPSKDSLINSFIDRCYDDVVKKTQVNSSDITAKSLLDRFIDIKLHGFQLPNDLGKNKNAMMTKNNL